MCDLHQQADEVQTRFGVSRRLFLKAAEVAALAGGTAMLTAAPAAAQPVSEASGRRNRTRLVLLGTAGGPNLNGSPRKGICTAVVYEDRVYLVDLGHGSHTNLHAAGLAGSGQAQAFSRIRGIFFTHLHSDHIAEWPALYLTGATNTIGAVTTEPIKVFGPGDRATLPRVNPPARPEPPVINPELPMPGITAMTGYLQQAFGYDLNDRVRDNNMLPPSQLFETHDIDISRHWNVDNTGVPPILAPGTRISVWEDGDVRITATLVDHHPTAPAFAYRFDTPDGSVVISGDTAPSPNLVDLAQGTDYLVHEVIDAEYVDRLVAQLPETIREGVKAHLLEAHTTIAQVGPLAERAGAKNLVLTHLVPAENPVSKWKAARRGYTGKLIVGEDLLQLSVGR